jgi:hypothetical protein
MEIRELYGDETETLAQLGREALGVRFPSHVELGVLRANPRALLPVAVAGTEIVGVALAELYEDADRRVGVVRLVASFLGGELVDRAIKLALVSRLERKLKDLEADEIQVLRDQDPKFVGALESTGYRLEAWGGGGTADQVPSDGRLVRQLRTTGFPWARPTAPSPSKPRVIP